MFFYHCGITYKFNELLKYFLYVHVVFNLNTNKVIIEFGYEEYTD